ncbi:MAG: hypothetical protein U9N62_00080 [Thermotogota bacterium]|nr:hypothetical protein [Thermotogota bacterium]
MKGGVHFRLSEYAQALCVRLGISEDVIREVIAKGTQTEICDGLATSFCFCPEDFYNDPRWTGLNVVVSNQTDTIVSVFFLR